MQAHPGPAAERLPALREDLELREGAIAVDGTPTWLIYDPMQHRYVQFDRATFEILTLWRDHAMPAALIEAVRQKFGQVHEPAEIERLAAFFKQQRLTVAARPQDWWQLARAASHREGLLKRLVHNYLFFRLPLCNPDPFLRRTLPLVHCLFTRGCALALVLAGLIGLYFVSRQWDAFLATAARLMTLEGATLFATSLFAIKGFHELGHAYASVRYGCRVPNLGLAFMMMAPLLYTDVTDAWRLTNRRQRLFIDAAGVLVELGIACIATFLWVFLPDGIAKEVAFLFATTSWIMSIGINLNPLMRFDGYYILSDVLKIENLQARAFEFGVWKLREILFDLRIAPPEQLPRRSIILLIAYAWSIWLYRLVLFTGIAFVVYNYFFKALGIVLFLFEIGYFIARPLHAEFRIWWGLRSRISERRRVLWPVGTVVVLLLVFVVPWSGSVVVPAIVEAKDLVHIFPPRTARIKSVNAERGASVDAGALILELESPELDNERRQVQAKLQLVRFRLARRGADETDKAQNLELEREFALLSAREKGLAREQAELSVRAQRGGIVVELNPELHAGRWIGQREQIAMVAGATGLVARGYISEQGLARVKTGAEGRFVPDSPSGRALDIRLDRIAISSSPVIDVPELASQFGGAVPTQPDQRQRPVPAGAHYLVVMTVPNEVSGALHTVRGVVWLTAERESIATGVWRHVLKVLVRESGA